MSTRVNGEATASQEVLPTLSADEQQALAVYEDTIAKGLDTFMAVGQALAQIHIEQLYRGTHRTWDAYCRERWRLSRFYAHRQITAARVAEMLPNGNKPKNEAVARELAPLIDDPEAVCAVWQEALALTSGGTPTAAMVRKARVQHTGEATRNAGRRATRAFAAWLEAAASFDTKHVEVFVQNHGANEGRVIADPALRLARTVETRLKKREQDAVETLRRNSLGAAA
jgi:hypothetical protein